MTYKKYFRCAYLPWGSTSIKENAAHIKVKPLLVPASSFEFISELQPFSTTFLPTRMNLIRDPANPSSWFHFAYASQTLVLGTFTQLSLTFLCILPTLVILTFLSFTNYFIFTPRLIRRFIPRGPKDVKVLRSIFVLRLGRKSWLLGGGCWRWRGAWPLLTRGLGCRCTGCLLQSFQLLLQLGIGLQMAI